MDKCDPG